MTNSHNDNRELLELAAKAAGLNLTYCTAWGCMAKELQDSEGKYFDAKTCWNPITDDGDALRLAVKLEMTLGVGVARGDAGEATEFDLCHRDPCAATRRAIVRAAAEIGKAKK